MTASLVEQLGAESATAPPRSNGELVFSAPWESRAFGLAISMVESGQFDWDEFRVHLSARIALGEQEAAAHGSYYECWLDALETLSVERGVIDAQDVGDRARVLAERAPGHDHGDHDHGDHDH
ncbi:nitrile hydratase accessory protein [Lapillicoccus sp.]|uniref:nitrile hydratase accessory protein n=1 Tax=Lapillicoccus sp. TaxID=1909287 RepID=UPI003983D543